MEDLGRSGPVGSDTGPSDPRTPLAPGPVVAVAEWSAASTDPPAVRPGDQVRVGRRDTEWPEFRWCIDTSGRQGWLPDAVLGPVDRGKRAAAISHYDARELTVRPGQRLLAVESLAGWTWCEHEGGGSGWVPDRVLAPVAVPELPIRSG